MRIRRFGFIASVCGASLCLSRASALLQGRRRSFVGARSRAIAATFLLALLPTLANAAAPTGHLEGLAQRANTDVNIAIDIKGKTANVHFGPTLSCDITANFLKTDGDATIYRFNLSTNGGSFCDGLKNDLTFKPVTEKDGTTEWSISFSSAKNDWTGRVATASATAP